MHPRSIGKALLAAAVLALVPTSGWAQDGGGFQTPGGSFPTLPIPTGPFGGPNQSSGFYGATEFVFLTQSQAIGNQTIAYRGIVDSTGNISGLAGTYLGSGVKALSTDNFGRTNFFPGYNIELGYKFEDGTRIYASYMQLFQSNYTDGATLAPQYSRTNASLTDTFLVSGVFNFSPQFSGPQQKTIYDFQPQVFQPQQVILQGGSTTITAIQAGTVTTTTVVNPQFIGTILQQVSPTFGQAGFNPGFNTYGIWNGASTMDIKFSERFTSSDIGIRKPIFETDYSKVYAIAGGRFAWFFERFTWITTDYDINGSSAPQYAATYTNTLSQRMYGPYVGCGHEIYAGNAFSLSTDLTGAALLDVVKDRTKYELDDRSTESKRGLNIFTLVPNVDANVNLWWYPTEGVQVRVGYQAQMFFGTKYEREAVGFNFDAPDPAIDTKYFRIVHGVNVGLGLFF